MNANAATTGTDPNGSRNLLFHETIEDLQQGIHDRLAERIGGGGDLFVALLSLGERKVAAFLGNNRLRPLYGPKGEIAAAGDRHRLGIIHGIHFRSVQRKSLLGSPVVNLAVSPVIGAAEVVNEAGDPSRMDKFHIGT